ncbi:MAG: ComEC/Rec2 family competence protein [Ruminococcaceae bacterium]|nr:ComEC/Rec2 family competence protein [Oscillospiraceae bacterium]
MARNAVLFNNALILYKEYAKMSIPVENFLDILWNVTPYLIFVQIYDMISNKVKIDRKAGKNMQIAKGRPLAVFCWILSIVAALYICLDLSVNTLVIALLLSAVALLSLFLFSLKTARGKYVLKYLAFLSLALVLGFSSVLIREKCDILPAEQYATQLESGTTEISGMVVSEEFYSSYLTCVGVRLDLPDGDTTKLYLNLTGEHDMRIGDRFIARAVLFPTLEAPEEERTLRQLQADGYILVGYVDGTEDCETIERDIFVFRQWLSRLQYRLSDRLTSAVGGEQGRLSSALLLGTKDRLSDATMLDFRRAGASHLLALSGLHLSLIMLALTALLGAVRCPFYLRITLLSLTAVAFLALTGFSVSMLRATFMLLCLYLSRLRGTPHDPLTPLSVFLGVTLTIQPTTVYDAGLWLTVLATFALVAVIPALFRNEKKASSSRMLLPVQWIWHKLLVPILSSLVILLVLIVPMALIFGEVSIMSPLANLVLTPLTALSLILGLAYFPLSYIGAYIPFLNFLAGWTARILYSIANGMIILTQKMSDIPGALVSLRYEFVGVLLVILVCAMLWFLLSKWKKPHRFLYVMAAWVAVFFVCLTVTNGMTAGQWQASYVSNKKNELLCLSNNEMTVLCDVTDGSYTAYRDFFAEGKPDGTTEIDALVLTHFHNRHVSTVYKLLGDIRVRTIWLPLTMTAPGIDQDKAIKDEGNLRAIVALAKQRRVEVCYYIPEEGAAISETLVMNQLYFSMLKRSTHPTVSFTFEYRSNPNNEGKRLTWLGSSAWEGELADEALLTATASDAIIFSKHGPVIKTSYSLIDWANIPDIVLFADGNTAAAIEASKEVSVVLKRAEKLLGGEYAEMTLP